MADTNPVSTLRTGDHLRDLLLSSGLGAGAGAAAGYAFTRDKDKRRGRMRRLALAGALAGGAHNLVNPSQMFRTGDILRDSAYDGNQALFGSTIQTARANRARSPEGDLGIIQDISDKMLRRRVLPVDLNQSSPRLNRLLGLPLADRLRLIGSPAFSSVEKKMAPNRNYLGFVTPFAPRILTHRDGDPATVAHEVRHLMQLPRVSSTLYGDTPAGKARVRNLSGRGSPYFRYLADPLEAEVRAAHAISEKLRNPGIWSRFRSPFDSQLRDLDRLIITPDGAHGVDTKKHIKRVLGEDGFGFKTASTPLSRRLRREVEGNPDALDRDKIKGGLVGTLLGALVDPTGIAGPAVGNIVGGSIHPNQKIDLRDTKAVESRLEEIIDSENARNRALRVNAALAGASGSVFTGLLSKNLPTVGGVVGLKPLGTKMRAILTALPLAASMGLNELRVRRLPGIRDEARSALFRLRGEKPQLTKDPESEESNRAA